MADSALDGLRVVEFTDETGSYCGRLLADLGAEVIKVEPPSGGRQRHTPPYFEAAGPGPNSSLAFWVHNTSKQSVVLDLETAAGRESARALAVTADVVLEDHPVGYMAARGLAFEDLRADRPSLVYASVTGFGQDGPHARYAYSDVVGQAMAGVMTLAGFAEDPPNMICGNQANVGASIQAALGILLAVLHAQETGEGQRIDVSAQEAIQFAQETAIQTWDFQKKNRVRNGGRGPLSAQLPGTGVFRCRDGYVLSGVGAGRAGAGFTELVNWMREHGMAGDLDEAPYAELCANMNLATITELLASPEHGAEIAAALDHISDLVAVFYASLTAMEAYEQGQGRRLLLGLVSTPKDLAESRQLRGRDWFHTVEFDHLGTRVEFPGAPYRLSETPVRIGRPPALGEHALETLLATPRPRPRPATAQPSARKLPLEGIRVADFSWWGAGPIASQALASFGAEVVRIESEAKVDGLRSAQPLALDAGGAFRSGYNVSGYFNTFNSGKLSLRLNLNTANGQDLACRLIERSDIFLANHTPRVIEKWNLGYERLAAVNPRIIAAYAPLQGMAGPHREYLGFGTTVAAIAGVSYLTGFADRDPIGVGTAYPDYVINPGHIATAVLAALHYRNRTDRGQLIELSQMESVANVIGTGLVEHLANGHVSPRSGNRSPGAAPHGVFRCADDPGSVNAPDRWIAIACRDDREWSALCHALGAPQAATDSRFATADARHDNEDALEALVGDFVRTRTAEQVMELLQTHGVPAGVVQHAQDILERDAHMRERGFYRWVEHPEAGPEVYYGPSMRLPATPGVVRRAPLFGEHTAEVCERILGLSTDEIADLVAEGVLA